MRWDGGRGKTTGSQSRAQRQTRAKRNLCQSNRALVIERQSERHECRPDSYASAFNSTCSGLDRLREQHRVCDAERITNSADHDEGRNHGVDLEQLTSMPVAAPAPPELVAHSVGVTSYGWAPLVQRGDTRQLLRQCAQAPASLPVVGLTVGTGFAQLVIVATADAPERCFGDQAEGDTRPSLSDSRCSRRSRTPSSCPCKWPGCRALAVPNIRSGRGTRRASGLTIKREYVRLVGAVDELRHVRCHQLLEHPTDDKPTEDPPQHTEPHHEVATMLERGAPVGQAYKVEALLGAPKRAGQVLEGDPAIREANQLDRPIAKTGGSSRKGGNQGVARSDQDVRRALDLCMELCKDLLGGALQPNAMETQVNWRAASYRESTRSEATRKKGDQRASGEFHGALATLIEVCD